MFSYAPYHYHDTTFSTFLGGWQATKHLIRDWVFPRHSEIVVGSDASPGQYPHQVFISAAQDHKSWICGGSLITDQHVLTAAHCIYQMDYVVLLFGCVCPWYATGMAVQFATQSNFFIHPNFVPKTLKNDIAIIKLSRPLPLTSKVNVIRLPRLGKSSPLFYEGKEGIATGWGITSDDYPRMSTILQQARVRIMKQYTSRSWFKMYGYPFSNSQFCSQYRKTGTGTTYGDSGGPLIMREKDGRWTLVGVTSFGDVKCKGDIPSVYSNVAIFLPWIRKETGIKLRKRY